VGQGGRVVRGPHDRLGLAASRVTSVEVTQEQVAATPGDRQQVVEVVGDATRQSSHRFHLLGLTELLFETLALGEVADDGHPDQASMVGDGFAMQFNGKRRAALA
jgi:hypothetical protein